MVVWRGRWILATKSNQTVENCQKSTFGGTGNWPKADNKPRGSCSWNTASASGKKWKGLSSRVSSGDASILPKQGRYGWVQPEQGQARAWSGTRRKAQLCKLQVASWAGPAANQSEKYWGAPVLGNYEVWQLSPWTPPRKIIGWPLSNADSGVTRGRQAESQKSEQRHQQPQTVGGTDPTGKWKK